MARFTIRRQTKKVQYYTEKLTDNIGLEMIHIPGGTFWMGTEEKEVERLDKEYDNNWFRRESPQHQVTVPLFFMGRYPITQDQWRIVADWKVVERQLEEDPSYFKEPYEEHDRWTRPVEKVSWYDAKEFCARLSRKTKRKYHLPSEAEWEYACRSVTNAQSSVNSEELTVEEWNAKYNQPFHFGETISTDFANYRGTDNESLGWKGNYGRGLKGEYREQTTPVGYFGVANDFGLCDMHGNVWELCEDDYHDSYEGAPADGNPWCSDDQDTTKILRGGSLIDDPSFCRSAYRNYLNPETRFYDIGFRVACSSSRTV